jgi:hypothetical protein
MVVELNIPESSVKERVLATLDKGDPFIADLGKFLYEKGAKVAKLHWNIGTI